MKKYEELSVQLKQAETNQELKQETEAITRAQAAVESLMMGGASEAELMTATGSSGSSSSGGFFGLKGLERMPNNEAEAAKAAAIAEAAEIREEDPEIRRASRGGVAGGGVAGGPRRRRRQGWTGGRLRPLMRTT